MQDINRAGKYVLFLGAGASKPLGAPDMAALFRGCDWAVRAESGPDSREFTHDEIALWCAVKEAVTPGDLEQALRVLDALSSPVFGDADSVLSRLMGRPLGVRPSGWQEAAANLRDYLKHQIVESLQPGRGSVPTVPPSEAFRPLFGAMRGLGLEVVGTTNYDTNIESLSGLYSFYDGFDLQGVWRGFSQEPRSHPNRAVVDLVKLHGSVNWYVRSGPVSNHVRRSDIAVGTQPVSLDGREMLPYLILPGGAKEQSSDEVAVGVRERLWHGLMSTELAVVIGYSFRDTYLVGLFGGALRENRDLLLVVADPDAEAICADRLRSLPSERISVLSVRFGGEDFEERLESTIQEWGSFRLIEPPSTQRVTYRSGSLTPVPESALMSPDALSLAGEVITVPHPQDARQASMAVYGPYARLKEPGRYAAFFRVRAPGADGLPASRDVLLLQVAARKSAQVATDDQAHVVDERAVRAEELCPCDRFATLDVGFDWDLKRWDDYSLELRIITFPHGPHPQGLSELRIDTRWVRYIGPLRPRLCVADYCGSDYRVERRRKKQGSASLCRMRG